MSELSEAINEMRNMRESYDQIGAAAEAYNTGKTELAANINAKGIQASATETLPELAEKVGAIAQTQTILEGGEIYAAQQFGDGALWNLYQVLADMKTRFIGNGDYSALIVCEYYKGYDSLQLQGADAYYTCDGDLYEYASPHHVWHDADNGKANRWVAFLYRDEGARLDITNTAISPRSMYIGGHIGTIEYFVNGRLTELVCGVEETDIVDNFLSKSYTQSWGFNCSLRNLSVGTSGFNCSSGGVLYMKLNNMPTANNIITTSSTFLCIYGIDNIKAPSSSGVSKLITCTNAIEIHTDAKYFTKSTFGSVYLFQTGNAFQRIYAPNCLGISGAGMLVYNSTNMIDLYVGAATSSLNVKFWNPTNVLADATKKAKLIDNIKNHILARVSDRTGLSRLTCTFSSNLYNAVSGETITWNDQQMTLADAFLTKNWLLAGA